MNWAKNLSMSVKALGRSRLRTIMSSASMAIGIAAVVMLLGVSAGAEQAFEQALEELGKNLLSVDAQRIESSALRGRSTRHRTLTLSDWKAIIEELDTVELAAPIAMGNFNVDFKGRSVKTTVIGTSPEFQKTNNQQLFAGRFFNNLELQSYKRVALVGAEVANKLFQREAPIGQLILINKIPFTIIGLLKEKGADMTGSSQDDRILIPATTATRRLLGVNFIDRIFVQAASKDKLQQANLDVRGLLRERHSLGDKSDDFTVRDQASLLNTLKKTDSTLESFLGGIAVLTLSLASLGLLAVSVLSVRERSSEIGLRIALGALPFHILMQFICETIILSLLGALLGLIIGIVGIIIVKSLFDWQLVFTWASVFYTFFISLILSILFGAYPAMQAAKLDPIIALKMA